MLVLKMLILAIVQGVAEFLPIGSSGHLVLLGHWLQLPKSSGTVEIILHAGTLASILVIYWRRIIDLLAADRRVIPLLVVGTIPAGVAGVIVKTQFEWILESPLLAGSMLLVTGAMLLSLRYLPESQQAYQELTYGKVFMIGCFQAFALLPGISRSGSTIVGGRLGGLKREDAVTFSFLLAIPAILGATVLKLGDLLGGETSVIGAVPLALGAGVAFLVGILALRWLIAWAREGRLYLFSLWCIPLGLLVIALHLLGYLESPPPTTDVIDEV